MCRSCFKHCSVFFLFIRLLPVGVESFVLLCFAYLFARKMALEGATCWHVICWKRTWGWARWEAAISFLSEEQHLSDTVQLEHTIGAHRITSARLKFQQLFCLCHHGVTDKKKRQNRLFHLKAQLDWIWLPFIKVYLISIIYAHAGVCLVEVTARRQ